MKRLTAVVLLLVAWSAGGIEGQGLPQPPQGMEGRAQLMFPAVVDFLYDGDFDVVPDDRLFRAYVVSVFRGMEQLCGTWESEQDGPARDYGITWLEGSGGEAGEPLIAGLEAFLGVGGDPVDRAVAAGDSVASPPVAYMTEGIQDGAALAATFQCNSLEGRTLRSRMLALFAQEPEAPRQELDPARCLRLLHPQWRDLFDGCGVPSWSTTSSSGRPSAGEERRILIQQDDEAYQSVLSTRALPEARSYMRAFGTWGIHVREVRTILDSLDVAAFEEAEATGTVPAFHGYLDTFPGGLRTEAALAAIAAIEERAWAGARLTRTDSAFTSYLALYPEGVYAADARTLLELSPQARTAAATLAAVQDTLRSARTLRTLSGVGSLATFTGAGVLGFLAYRGYGRFNDLEQQLALVSPDSLAVFGPLDAEKSATGRRTAFQAATSAALVGVALMLRSAWQEYSLAAETARVARSQATDSLGAIQDRMDRMLDGSPPDAGSLLPSLSVHPTLDSRGTPGVVVRWSLRIGGGGTAGPYRQTRVPLPPPAPGR